MSYNFFIKEGVYRSNVIELCRQIWQTTILRGLDEVDEENLTAQEIQSLLVREIGVYGKSCNYCTLLNLIPDAKDNAKAAMLRIQGNELFQVKRYMDAVVHYNESVAHSTKGSSERAVAYANRSAVCIQLGRYDDCRENIRLARESNLPAALLTKLSVREMTARSLQACAELQMSHVTELQEETKLSHPAHPNVPQMVQHLKLLHSETFGRHVVTGQPLNVGDVVLIEKPYATTLSAQLKRVRCAHCHAEQAFVLIPCEQCTVALYCSQRCLRAAWQQYHRYECPILRNVWQFGTEYLAMTVRTLSVALGAFGHDLEAMRNHLSHLDVAKVNAFEVDWAVATPQDVYETVYALATNQTMRPAKDLALHVLVATITHELLLKRTAMGRLCGADPVLQRALFKLVLHHLLSTLVNHQLLSFLDYRLASENYEPKVYAMGCFPLLSMFNHSCAPNVESATLRDGRCALIVTRPIPAGAQLFLHYEAHHWTLEREERQMILKHLYRFVCRCEACEAGENIYTPFVWYTEHDFKRLRELLSQRKHGHLAMQQPAEVKRWLSLLQTIPNETGHEYQTDPMVFSYSQLIHCYQIMYTSKTSLAKYR